MNRDLLAVVKRNKRLMIVELESKGGGPANVIYSPPDFLRPHMRDRLAMHELCNELKNGVEPIVAIMAFESRHAAR